MDEYRLKKKKDFPYYYALKYNITTDGITYKELLFYIYRYEMENYVALVRSGIDNITKEYGYFLIA
jgi:hypothetical protein